MIEINGKFIKKDAVLVVQEHDEMGGSLVLMSSGDWILLDSSVEVITRALGV